MVVLALPFGRTAAVYQRLAHIVKKNRDIPVDSGQLYALLSLDEPFFTPSCLEK